MIKECLANPLVLQPPKEDVLLLLHLMMIENTMGTKLA